VEPNIVEQIIVGVSRLWQEVFIDRYRLWRARIHGIEVTQSLMASFEFCQGKRQKRRALFFATEYAIRPLINSGFSRPFHVNQT